VAPRVSALRRYFQRTGAGHGKPRNGHLGPEPSIDATGAAHGVSGTFFRRAGYAAVVRATGEMDDRTAVRTG
jgi:hypothetical protein